jgi:hypothetical protein
MTAIKGLIIDTPYIDRILAGEKTWEMRSSQTKQRGTIALIRKGSGQVFGLVDLVDSRGPFTREQMLENQSKHKISSERLADPKVAKWNNAWVLTNVVQLSKPVPYQHPPGAVIWVNLDEATRQAVMRAAGK